MLTVLKVAAYFWFVQAVLLLPAAGFLAWWPSVRRNRFWLFCGSYCLSMATLGVVAMGGYVLGMDKRWLALVLWMLIGAGGYGFIKHKVYRIVVNNRGLMVPMIVLAVMSTIIISYKAPIGQNYLPDPNPLPNRNYAVLSVKVLNFAHTQANDNYIPYRQAQFISNRSNPRSDSFISEWGVHFFQRTPLMGAVTAGIFNLTGDNPPVDYTWSAKADDKGKTYLKFQIIAHILNSLLLLPGYFLIKQLFKAKVANVSVGLLSVSSFLIYNSVFSWPKSLAAFFILCAAVALLQEDGFNRLMLAGAVGLAYLTHDLALIYAASILIILVWQRRWRRLLWAEIGLIVGVPWVLVSALIFHSPSSFIYYPFALKGIPQTAETGRLIGNFLRTPVLEILGIKLTSLLYLLTPYQLFTSEGGQSLVMRNWGLGLYSLPGALGYGPMVLAGLLVTRVRAVRWKVVLAAILPILISVVLIGWPKGLGALHFAQASVAVLVGVIVAAFIDRPNWLKVALLINIVQLAVFVADGYEFSYSLFFKPGSNLILTLILMAVVAWQAARIWSALDQDPTELNNTMLSL